MCRFSMPLWQTLRAYHQAKTTVQTLREIQDACELVHVLDEIAR